MFIALALGRLADRGDVLYRVWPATGWWSYNGVISYWALPSGSSSDDEVTWEQYALRNHLNPLA